MLLFNDILTGKDLFSDAYPLQYIENECIISIQSDKIKIGGLDHIEIGANESQETKQDENDEIFDNLNDGNSQVINVVHRHELQKVEIKTIEEFNSLQKNYWKLLVSRFKELNKDITDFKANFPLDTSLSLRKKLLPTFQIMSFIFLQILLRFQTV